MGIIVISLDAELAWGFYDSDNPPKDRIKNERNSWLKILELFDKYNINATWAVVGHLFLDKCDGLHKDHPAGKERFKNDPGGTLENNKNWFGLDLIEKIKKAKSNHEIACHSFSHFSFDSTDNKIIEAELRLCKEVAEKIDINLKSFVFPKNKIGNKILLKKYGFIAYRGKQPLSWYDKVTLNRNGMIADFYRNTGIFIDFSIMRNVPPIIHPIIDEYDMVNIPASLYLFDYAGKVGNLTETISTDPILSKAIKGINYVAKNEGIFHLWFHPNNLVKDKDHTRLINILKYIHEIMEENNSLEIKTMKEIAIDKLKQKNSIC